MKKSSFSQAFKYALRGFGFALKEPNFKRHLVVAILVIFLGLYLDLSLTDWAIIFLCIGMVICMEVINTAIERAVDLFSPEIHPLAGKAKDLSAAAVLTVSITAAVVAAL